MTAAQLIDRSLLGRLHAEEVLLQRRRAAVTNLGSTWLKPPGLTKTLFQMREERREAEEHAEAMRREMLAQELAEAEAEAAAQAAAAAEDDGVLPGSDAGMGSMMEGDGMRDLDADIPDADDAGGFGYDGASSDEDEDEDEDDEDEEEEEEEEEEDEEEEEEEGSPEERQERLERRREAERIHAMEERLRQVDARADAVLRARESRGLFNLDEGPYDDLSEDERSQLLEEEDLVRADPPRLRVSQLEDEVDPDMDLGDMGADLDDDIPDAESGDYEHTDSEASLDSDDPGHDLSYARSSRMLHSIRRNEAPRSSIDISGLLSGDGSSMVGSSPHVRRGMP